MPALAVVIVLSSALVHAVWNMVLASVPRGPETTAVGLALGLVVWAPLVLLRWHVDLRVWPYLVASAGFQLAYMGALNAAYARAPAHVAYPVARGLAPVLLLPVAAVAAGGVPLVAGLGVLAIGAGVLVISRGSLRDRGALYGVPVAACIAGYTFVDAHGLRYAEPVTYLWLSMAPVVVALLALRLRSGRAGRAKLRSAVGWPALVVGIGVFVAYGLTLVALSMVSPAQVPAVAALRETSILFVLGLSWLAARRRSSTVDGQVGLVGAVLVFGGVVVLALS